MSIAITIGLGIVNLIGLILTLIGLPGIWMMIAIAIALQVWRQDLFNIWVLVICVMLGLIGEVIEFISGAAGSKLAGGSKRAGVGAMIGALVGAILGATFPPVIGAVIWGVVGAGLGAMIAETTRDETHIKNTLSIGGAAAAGRFVGIISKVILAAMVYVLILINATISCFT